MAQFYCKSSCHGNYFYNRRFKAISASWSYSFAYVSVNTHKGLYDMLGVNLYHKWAVCFIGTRFSSQTLSLAKLTFAVPECTTTEDNFQVKNNVFTVMHLQWKSMGKSW